MAYVRCLLTLWLLLIVGSTMAQANCREEFGSDWAAARRYVSKCHSEWKRVFDDFGVDARMAEAIVFPELLRYSMWQDEIERAAVHALYIIGGKEKANFSIGRFQMKPSFAEDLEHEWNSSSLAKEYGFSFNLLDNPGARRSRIHRLSDIIGQCRYLAIFIRLQQLRHHWLNVSSPKDRLRYLATAYNYSHTASRQAVERMQYKRKFHTDIVKTRYTRLYCYADIAEEFLTEEYDIYRNPNALFSNLISSKF